MYNLLCIDHADKKQIIIDEIAYLDRARDRLLNHVLDFVVSKMGVGYLNRLFYRKANLPFGYSIVKKETDYMCKYSVFHREANGYFYTGKTSKVRTYLTVLKPNNKVVEKRKCKLSETVRNYYNSLIESFTGLMKEFQPTDLLRKTTDDSVSELDSKQELDSKRN